MATTFLVTKNRAVSTLASGINDAVTSLDVAAGEGALFPSTYPFHITIDDEILSCTNRSTDTLTVVRAEQGTVAASHSTAASVSLNITAKNVSDLNSAVNAIENQVAYGRLDGWTLNKLLKGAGAGSDPTEVDPGVSDPHGAGQHSDVTRYLFLPSNSTYIGTGSPGQAQNFGAVSGAANANEPRCFFNIKVPDDFVSFTSLKAVWACGAASGNMYWQFIINYNAPGEDYYTHADSPAIGVTATGGANIVNVQESTNPVTLASLTINDYIGVRFSREGTNGSDTLDATMYLIGILFTYTAHQ